MDPSQPDPDRQPGANRLDPVIDPAESSGTPQDRDDQAADDPRGDDEVRRELGPGDGDDAPPVTGDEPSPR